MLDLVIDGWGIYCEIAHKWFSQGLIDDKSTLSQGLVPFKAISHYLNQCRPSFLMPYGFTRQHWVKLTHWGRDKMATNFLTTFSNAFSQMKIYKFWLRVHWSFFPRVQLNNIPALFQIMACRRPGDNPLTQPMMINLLLPQWINLTDPEIEIFWAN